MVRSHALVMGLFAFALLAVEAGFARADVPPFGGPRVYDLPPRPPNPEPPPLPNPLPTPPAPNPPAPAPQPTLQQGAIDPATGLPYPPPRKPDPPRRTGPFRSCGSGMGAGLAGIALAWGALWLGNRFARTTRSPSARG